MVLRLVYHLYAVACVNTYQASMKSWMLAFHPVAFSHVLLKFSLKVLCSRPAHMHSNAPGHISTTLPVGFKGTKTLMNFSIDSGPVVPKATV